MPVEFEVIDNTTPEDIENRVLRCTVRAWGATGYWLQACAAYYVCLWLCHPISKP